MLTPPPDTLYRLIGRAVHARSKEPLEGLVVRAFDHDRGRPDRAQPLGSPQATDSDGRFVVEFTQKEAGGRTEGFPEPLVVFETDRGDLLYQTVPNTVPTPDGYSGGPIDGPVSHDLKDLHVVVGRPGADRGGPEGSGETAGGAGVGLDKAPERKDPSHRVGTQTYHGSKARDYVAPRSPFFRGPFGRLFRQVPAWVPPGGTDVEKEANIRTVAAAMIEDEAQSREPSRDNDRVPAGYTYFGQFIDHDVTFDPASSLTKQNDPERLVNFRTPRFDLDNLYGEGPDDEPFLYDRDRPGRFLIGPGPDAREDDLPRNAQGVALIGDPRNDENLIVSQLQLAFLRLHNRVLERVQDEEGLEGRDAFHRAQNLVRWLYQWVVLFDYLPRTCGNDLVQLVHDDDEDVRARAVLRRRHESEGPGEPFVDDLRFYGYKEAPFMPVEFSVAAYRLGHSQIRDRYDLNDVVRGVPIFRFPHVDADAFQDLRGGRPLPPRWSMDWRRFFDIDGSEPQPTRVLDPLLSFALKSIPAGPDPSRGSPLAELNLLRGFQMGLPSGQAVARAMGEDPIPNGAMDLPADVAGAMGPEAPLWYYVLEEARQHGGGRHLGPVGGRIVAEVFVGLAKGDPNSFLNVDPTWTPEVALGGPDGRKLVEPREAGRVKVRDLLLLAGVGGAPF